MPPHLTPTYTPSSAPEPPALQRLIHTLSLQPHMEGGYFAETDRSPHTVRAPWSASAQRCASTGIFYLLTPHSPQGGFHRNAARTVHTHHRGRGTYVVIHADEPGAAGKKAVESFVVGPDVEAGERLQWVVEGGKYKASFLMEDADGGSGGLLISETVVPGFEYADHDVLTEGGMWELLGEGMGELKWLLRGEW